MISIRINEQRKEVQDKMSLEQLIDQIRDSDKGIAVAVNNTVVSRGSWKELLLNQDDSILIIQATQGG